MQDSTLAIVSVCAISLICAALVGLVLFLALRFTGHTLSEFLGGGSVSDAIDSMAGVEKPPGGNAYIRRRTTPGDLRAQADSLDFDAAVARYRDNPNQPSTTTPPASQQVVPPRTQKLREDTPDRRRSNRRRNLEEIDQMEDMYGGFIEDGDDPLPF